MINSAEENLLPHFLTQNEVCMEILYKHFMLNPKCKIKYYKKFGKPIYSMMVTNFDRGNDCRNPVEKPVECVNNFLHMRCIPQLWKPYFVNLLSKK
jgi:hypothetical protein